MPSKAEFYRQMAEQVSTQLVGSWKEWTAFLTTAARLYKYPFHEQMMIYAQRPDATACAEYDLWNDKMGRYVRRGSKGIALVDDSGDKPRLRYVFDISDTGTREHSRTPWLWQLEEQHIEPVSAMLEQNYGLAGDDLAQQLTDVAGKLASEYWDDHQRDFRYIVDGSFLAEYDDYNIEVQFKSAATVSIAYALMSRCGLDTEQYFQHEDFMPIFDFNTPATVGALGAAVSQINQQVLRQIGVTIQNYEREQLAERSVTHAVLPVERGCAFAARDVCPSAGRFWAGTPRTGCRSSDLPIRDCGCLSGRQEPSALIISAPLQSVYDVQIGVIGSQQNNRNIGCVFLDLPEQLEPAAIRQIDIQQDQGYTAAKKLFLRRF